MEKRKDSLSTLNICRFCLSQDDSISSLYDRAQKPNNAVPLSLKILSCLSIEAFPSDKMPSFICKRCVFFMDLFYEYKQICRKADERILQYIQKGTALETLNFPASLTKIFRFGYKTSMKHPCVVKTIVEGGATVQVTSQDMSHSEEEDEENVYNIKIGDDSANGSKCIKVVASKGDQDNKDPGDEDSQLESGRALDEGCWPCDQCDCTYALKQLLQLHKRQKHRERTVSCDQCDAKFFSKYDLSTHLLRHSDEMPFQCVGCGKKFKRLVLLKRHERLIHSDIPQLPCPNCPASFLSHEELEAHQRRHVRHSERRHACKYCDKKFLEKTTLHRHIELIHEKKAAFRCEYCPAHFNSVSKLTRHLRSHAGDRPYPCKYCDKSFTKSHHYTRHVRLKHRGTLRSSRGPFGAPDQYRCDQCEVSFTTQDELIYHSAIHATQNLTCPLCQEKFENVDAVTAHIKSHVNGIEFMCDLCELVFTTKEKLDTHLTAAHADEIANEMGHDDSSLEMDMDDDEDDNIGINVKEEDGEMVVEIKKPDGFMLPEAQTEVEEKIENMNSEESESEATYTELSTVDTLAMVRKGAQVKSETEVKGEPGTGAPPAAGREPHRPAAALENQTASILRKAEEVKRKVQQSATEVAEKKEKTVPKVESSNSGGASDKSLRLLEKELQELKRTNTRNEVSKTPAKPMENLRNRRPQLYTSTPKTRNIEEKKSALVNKSPALEKKLPERKIVTKENKEPKEPKQYNSIKEEKEKEAKEIKEKEVKEVKEKETREVKEKEAREAKEKEIKEKEKDAKEKETPKSTVKNGTSEKNQPEENIRRSTRPSKIKDYAKMIRDKAQDSSDMDSDDADDEEYKEVEKQEVSTRAKRRSVKPPTARAAASPAPAPPAAPAPAPTASPAPRKRGRPRKEPPKAVPAKIRKEDNEEEETEKSETEESSDKQKQTSTPEKRGEPSTPQKPTADATMETDNDANKSPSADQRAAGGGVLVSPTGQTLKKVPIKSLPPGVKPLPLPVNARPSMGPGELCEMQIGKKVVKVQKIVMTKAEVEAMAKKGLVEMKDGTMVLKQGIKLPSSDSFALKTSLGADKEAAKSEPVKEYPSKVEKPPAAQTSVNDPS